MLGNSATSSILNEVVRKEFNTFEKQKNSAQREEENGKNEWSREFI